MFDALGRFVRTSFGAALVGGLVVAVVGLIAIGAGWVKSSDGAMRARRSPRPRSPSRPRGRQAARG